MIQRALLQICYNLAVFHQRICYITRRIINAITIENIDYFALLRSD